MSSAPIESGINKWTAPQEWLDDFQLGLKSFDHDFAYQAARYAHKLDFAVITRVFFVESVDDQPRAEYEQPYLVVSPSNRCC